MRFLIMSLAALCVGCAVQPQPAAAQTDAEKVQIIWDYLDKKYTDFPPVVQPPQPPDEPPGPPQPPPQPEPQKHILFSTTHETGPGNYRGFGDWEQYPDGRWRADWFSGQASGGIKEVTFAHSGRYVMALTIGNGESGARVTRHHYVQNGEHKALPLDIWMESWVYIPKKISCQWLMLMQYKQSAVDGKPYYNEPAVHLHFVGDTTYLQLDVKGRTPGDIYSRPPKLYTVPQTVNPKVPFPIGKWVNVKWHCIFRTGNDGLVDVWQDGQQIIHYQGRNWREGDSDAGLYITNYGNAAAGTLYHDDVTIWEQQ